MLRPEKVLSAQLWWTEVLQNQEVKSKRVVNYLSVESMPENDAHGASRQRLEAFWFKGSKEISV